MRPSFPRKLTKGADSLNKKSRSGVGKGGEKGIPKLATKGGERKTTL